MKNGNRLYDFLNKTEELLGQAVNENDPSMWLFTNNARTTFFMLEALARIYSGIYNRKVFSRLKDHFKIIEDGLGQIDFYNSLHNSIASDKKIPASCVRYVREELINAAARLNGLLYEVGWIPGNKRIAKIKARIGDIDWLESSPESEAAAGYFHNAIEDIFEFVDRKGLVFDNVEKDVHELRRRLRWLSIYPRALQGMFRFDERSEPKSHHEKYLTPDILNSPYINLPNDAQLDGYILLDKYSFMALSWIISKLGEIKDEGLLITGLAEAIRQTTGCNREESLARAFHILGKNQSGIDELLIKASEITRVFLLEKNLETLLTSTLIRKPCKQFNETGLAVR